MGLKTFLKDHGCSYVVHVSHCYFTRLNLSLTGIEKFFLFWVPKAELLQEGIYLFARDVLVMKKLEIGRTKPTFIISVLKVKY